LRHLTYADLLRDGRADYYSTSVGLGRCCLRDVSRWSLGRAQLLHWCANHSKWDWSYQVRLRPNIEQRPSAIRNFGPAVSSPTRLLWGEDGMARHRRANLARPYSDFRRRRRCAINTLVCSYAMRRKCLVVKGLREQAIQVEQSRL